MTTKHFALLISLILLLIACNKDDDDSGSIEDDRIKEIVRSNKETGVEVARITINYDANNRLTEVTEYDSIAAQNKVLFSVNYDDVIETIAYDEGEFNEKLLVTLENDRTIRREIHAWNFSNWITESISEYSYSDNKLVYSFQTLFTNLIGSEANRAIAFVYENELLTTVNDTIYYDDGLSRSIGKTEIQYDGNSVTELAEYDYYNSGSEEGFILSDKEIFSYDINKIFIDKYENTYSGEEFRGTNEYTISDKGSLLSFLPYDSPYETNFIYEEGKGNFRDIFYSPIDRNLPTPITKSGYNKEKINQNGLDVLLDFYRMFN